MKKNPLSQIQALVEDRKYFSVNAVKGVAREKRYVLNPLTINQYLYNLKERKCLYNAGRGWYSSIAWKFELKKSSVEALQKKIRSQFPLLPFSLWSTEQLQPFAHHVMTKFVTFIFAEDDAMTSVSNFLNDEGERSIVNPRKSEVDKFFNTSSVSVVIRPRITREPVEGHYAAIEKILIDLFLEKDRLQLMGAWEYQQIFRNLVSSQRINVARLLEYAERRKVKDSFSKTIIEPEKKIFLFTN